MITFFRFSVARGRGTKEEVRALDDMGRVYLLDANVLIALATQEHSLSARAAAWLREGHQFATCPITQGAPVRFHLRVRGECDVGIGEDAAGGDFSVAAA